MKSFADYVALAIAEGYEDGCPHMEARAYELQLADLRKEGLEVCLRHAIDADFGIMTFEEHFGVLPPLPGSTEYMRAVASGTAPSGEELRLTREFVELAEVRKQHYYGKDQLCNEVEKLVRKYGADFKQHAAYRWLIARGYGVRKQCNPQLLGKDTCSMHHQNSVALHNAIFALIM